jgi:2-(1,2-epoxy-1,2-dihydrophenyl)acetyl-CoA isomerase
MAASATLKPAFVNVGLPGDFGATWLWPDTFGAAEARRLFLFDESIEAAEALARGLVTKVFVDAELAEATQAEAERLARRPRSGVIAAKAALRRRGTTLGEAMDEEAIATGKAGRALRAAGQSPAHLFQRCN